MKGVRIGVWMAGLNVGLVVLVAAGLVPSGFLLLRKLALDSAGARVQLAAVSAAESLKLQAEEVLTGARLLAERPTLQRLVESGRTEELAAFLAQFRDTSQLDGCAVFTSAGLMAAAPADGPWAAFHAGAAQGLRYAESPGNGAAPLAVARVPLPGAGRGEALAFRWLDQALAQRLGSQVGLTIRVLSGAVEPSTETFQRGGAWLARRFVAGSPDEHRVGVEAELPAAELAAVLRPLQRSFVLATGAAVLVAVAAGLMVARRLSRPLRKLQAAAVGIGAGDLATPVPAIAGVEAGALASTMESMRRRLQLTTTELHQREMEARALLEGMVEGVFAVDGDRRIQYLNPQAARRLGLAVEDAVGRFCGDVLRPAGSDGRRPCADSCPIVHARSRGSSRAVEHLDLPYGRRTMVITSAPPAGQRQVQLMRDETETEAARRSRDAVLANVSHELKTPLSAQMASIQLLQDALRDDAPPAAVELVESLERSTLRLTRLIDNLLESVRIETGRASLRLVEVDLAAVVEEAEAMTYPLFRQRKQEVCSDFPAALAPIQGDPVQLTQVFVNLLANANKFSPEGATIRIGGASDDLAAAVWVEDAGPGIPAAERSSIFERYHRADPGAAEGMGLGLWIVKSIVDRHGGSVEASASAAGGARFTVRLPRTKAK